VVVQELLFPVPTVTVYAPPGPPTPLYLPLLDNHRCEPHRRFVDVGLVIDSSSTMTGAKHAAAKTAARQFVDRLVLPGDQAAIVGFNRTGWVAQGLTGDRDALHAAIDGLSIVPGTVIDAGLALATAELLGPRARASNGKVIVLLSDGLNNAGPEPVRAAAAAARRDGITIYAVAHGADADLGLLGEVAADASRLYVALRPEDLERIYGEIAGVIRCR
jgi:Ca-activated chloride channel homolog